MILLIAGVSHSDIMTQSSHSVQNKFSLNEFTDEDCYTYERVFEYGEWWIYVYDCDGNLIKYYLDDDD